MQRDAGTAKQAGAFIRGAYHELIAAWTRTFSVLRRHLNDINVFLRPIFFSGLESSFHYKVQAFPFLGK